MQSSTNESATSPCKVPCQNPMLRQTEWEAQNGPITKNGLLPLTSPFVWKFGLPKYRYSFFLQALQFYLRVYFLPVGIFKTSSNNVYKSRSTCKIFVLLLRWYKTFHYMLFRYVKISFHLKDIFLWFLAP